MAGDITIPRISFDRFELWNALLLFIYWLSKCTYYNIRQECMDRLLCKGITQVLLRVLCMARPRLFILAEMRVPHVSSHPLDMQYFASRDAQ